MEVLNKPYPIDRLLGPNVKFHLLLGFFVAFVLIVFQPFGTSNWVSDYKTLKLCGYGLISFAVPTMIFLLRNWVVDLFNFEQNYKVKHEILWGLIVLLLIVLANCAYIVFLHDVKFTFDLFLVGVFMVLAIGLFPIIAKVVISHNNYFKINTREAEILDDLVSTKDIDNGAQVLDMLTLVAENGKDKVEVDPRQLLYIESLENYVSVFYRENEAVTKKILRSSLTKIESQLQEASHILRCHRSFITNLHQVKHFSGNAQGYLMAFENYETKIPVSRAYGTEILGKLKHLPR